MALGDFNNDGLLDFVITGSSDLTDTQFGQNLGNGTFTNSTGNLPALNLSSVAVGDFDNDGKLDVVVMGGTIGTKYPPPVCQVWRNLGNGTFSKMADLPGLYNGAVAVADLDNDGYADIVVSGFNTTRTPTTQLWRNLGNGSFTNIPTSFPNLANSSISVADFDQDGRLDLLLTGDDLNGNPYSELWRNLGNMQFTNLNLAMPGIYFGTTAVGDYNNDGRPDFVMAGSLVGVVAATQLLQNQGQDTFSNAIAYLPPSMNGSAAWADSENDGRLDLLLTGIPAPTQSPVTFLFKNFGAVTNTPPTAPKNLSATLTLTNTILNWGPASDAQTPTAGLSYNVRIGTQPGGIGVVSPEADVTTGRRRVVALGNAGERLFSIYNLPPGTYYWSVQAIDTAYAGSPFSTESQFTVGAPFVTTGGAWPVSSNSAVLNGTFIADAADATAWFEWGTTTNYGNLTTAEQLSAGTAVLSLTLSVNPLQPLTTYFYRLVATNIYGTTFGAGASFTTPAAVPVTPPRFTSAAAQPGGGLLLSVQGQSYVGYTILTSTNLAQWSPFTNVTAGTDGTLQIRDTATNFPRRFYRLRYP